MQGYLDDEERTRRSVVERDGINWFVTGDRGRLDSLERIGAWEFLQELKKKGLIRREADGEDQRNKICHLTPKGQAMTPQLHKALADWEDACFEGLDPEELAQFRKTSEMISRNLMKE